MTAAEPKKSPLKEGSVNTSPWAKFLGRVSQGGLGPVPIVLGIAAIWIIFALANPRFLSPFNLSNLMLQVAAVGTISVGIVLVLLLGEIDLSVGSVSGLTAATMAVLSVKTGMPAALAILVALAVGAAIGAFNGFAITRLGVHSLVVTLAGLLGFQGAQLYVLGDTGTINLRDPLITGFAGTFFAVPIGWLLAALVVVAYMTAVLLERRKEIRAGIHRRSFKATLGRISAVGAAVVAGVAILNADRGVPLAMVIFLGFVVFFHLITKKTRFGRYLFAIGGNAEAARRAGIKVWRIRVVAFTLCSTLAAAGGILAASRLIAVNQASGSGDILLLAIAGPVIAGTSLMGGRGSVWAALSGALIIGSISNGMDLLAFDSSIKFMVTGAVLLAAIAVDAIASRRRGVA